MFSAAYIRIQQYSSVRRRYDTVRAHAISYAPLEPELYRMRALALLDKRYIAHLLPACLPACFSQRTLLC